MFFAAPLLNASRRFQTWWEISNKGDCDNAASVAFMCAVLSITLLLLADIHAPITDCAWIIHRRREEEDASRCCQMTPGVCEWVCLCSLTGKKEKEGNSKHQPRWIKSSLSWFCTQLENICSYYRVHSVRACVNTCLKVCPQIPTISFRGIYLYWEDMQGLSVFVNAPHFWTQ